MLSTALWGGFLLHGAGNLIRAARLPDLSLVVSISSVMLLPSRLTYSIVAGAILYPDEQAMQKTAGDMTKIIETARLVLRPFEDGDVDPLYRIQGDPDAMRYTFCAASCAESEQRLRAYAALDEQLGFAPWTVVLRAEPRIIGWGGLLIDPFDPGWGVEVAYFFDPAYWGQGYATELVQASTGYGFSRLGLPEIGAFARPQNAASIRVLEKCGFRYVCFEPQIARNHYVIHSEDWHKMV